MEAAGAAAVVFPWRSAAWSSAGLSSRAQQAAAAGGGGGGGSVLWIHIVAVAVNAAPRDRIGAAVASPAPAYCASPDVNTKADRFIESFREGLKLEKLNSYREKWQRQIQENAAAVEIEEEGEFMVIGSLFGDDDEDYDDGISLPQTPATAAVAVGF